MSREPSALREEQPSLFSQFARILPSECTHLFSGADFHKVSPATTTNNKKKLLESFFFLQNLQKKIFVKEYTKALFNFPKVVKKSLKTFF